MRSSFSSVRDVRRVTEFDDCTFYLRRVVAFVEAEMLPSLRRRLRPTSDYAVQRSRCRFHVVHVGFGD